MQQKKHKQTKLIIKPHEMSWLTDNMSWLSQRGGSAQQSGSPTGMGTWL